MSGRGNRAAGQARKRRRSQARPLKPRDDIGHWRGANGRWTLLARAQFALTLTAALTAKERLEVACGADLPGDNVRLKAAYDLCVELYHAHNDTAAKAEHAAMQQAQDAEPLNDPAEVDKDIEGQVYTAADECMHGGTGSEGADSISTNASDASASAQSNASWKQRVHYERAASANIRDSDNSEAASSAAPAPDAEAAKVPVPPPTPAQRHAQQQADAQAKELRDSIKTCASKYAKRLLR